ncbi:hypothetical protein ASPFODRAFT_522368 [Aspergillus luchuensis CBS 106.47]|uniref:Uncharacterized protein n=1 Tax=Aspergillus luchuensis (strain CBS 106.47) TaxID=1137211 RepID=A0A1M3TMP8_ASPLC|nr:hypothetical protein ASPFODRAFT_522368 [Aspergillus luchuensis CBS 106.47]
MENWCGSSLYMIRLRPSHHNNPLRSHSCETGGSRKATPLAKGPTLGYEGRSKPVDPDLCQMTTDEISEVNGRVIVVMEWEGIRNGFFIQCVVA